MEMKQNEFDKRGVPKSQRLTDDMDQASSENLPLEDISEAEIETNFKSYRPYIESCVKTMDLLVFFKLFTADQVKTLYKKTKADPVGAIKEAFDIVSEMKNTSYKFHHLLSALEEAEYPKIVYLLTGLLIRVHDNHRKKLQTFAKDIYQRLCVGEVLPYLLTKQVLNNHDVEEVTSTEKNESRGSAVILLLSILPNRNRDWYKHFLWGLLQSKQSELAMLIDQDMTENLEKAEEMGTENIVDDPSLTVSKEAFHHWLDSKGLKLQPHQQKGQLKRVESMLPLHVTPGQRTEDSSSKINDQKPSQDKTAHSFDCNPCRRKDSQVAATYYCRKCCDYFCQYCEDVHKRLRTTQNHDAVLIKTHTKISQKEINMQSCTCGTKIATFYCRSHENLACFGCREKCHSRCELLSIKDLDPGHHSKIDIDTCEKRNKLLKKRLRKLEFERENDQAKLNVSTESSKRNITTFASDLHKLINDQKDAVLNEINKREKAQKMYISGCREMCMILNQHLDYQLDILFKTRGTKDEFNTFVINLKVDKFLNDADHITEKMELAEYANTIDYKINENLEDLLRSNSIGKVPGHVTEAETAMVTDLKGVGNRIGNVGDAELCDMKRFLSDSCDIDPNYIEPYLHYIQTSAKTKY